MLAGDYIGDPGTQSAVLHSTSASRPLGPAEKDLSIPDQRRQLEASCKQHGFNVVAEYVEPGASGDR